MPTHDLIVSNQLRCDKLLDDLVETVRNAALDHDMSQEVRDALVLNARRDILDLVTDLTQDYIRECCTF